ncbi:MAG: hypothetical protein ACJ8LG_00275 [Massilia sp.]
MAKLNIGLLLDGTRVDKYVLDLLRWASAQDGLEISAAIVLRHAAGPGAGAVPAPPLHRIGSLFAALAFGLVMAVERLLIGRFRAHRSHLVLHELAEVAPGCTVIELLSAEPGAGAPPLDQRRVREAGLDLLVQFGASASAQDLAGAARLGLLVLDFHGKRASRWAPPGFWEAYHKVPKTEFEIRHVEPDSRACRTVASGSFRTKYLFLLNQAHLYSKSAGQLKGLLKAIAATRCLPAEDRSRPYSGPCFELPRPHQSTAYLGKVVARLAAKSFNKAFHFQEKWGISCIYANWKNAALWNSTRIAAPRGHFWADPFLCTHDGKTYCFVEDYVYKTRRGHIAVLEITGQGAGLLGDCIKEDFHLSFPFLFRYEGELFMCPESSEAREIRIYRCKRFPLEWELCWVAMDGISAADSMLFEHDGKWWMLTNIDRSGLDDHCSELCLFHASSPFDANWIAHPQNPLRLDADGGRNAGLILEDKRIFRGAQRQGFDQYGKGLMVYEILELNEQVYVERLVSELDCNFRNGLIGSHHMSTTGKITVVDHLDRCFFP